MSVAYIDESGNLADGNPFFVIAVVPIDDERLPSRIIKRTRSILGRNKGRVGGELKFNNSSIRVKKYFIERLVKEKVSCFVFVIEKANRKIVDSPENYGVILSWILSQGFKLWKWELAVVDRKYDKKRDQEKLLGILKSGGIARNKVDFVDSLNSDGVKLADFVAGFYSVLYNNQQSLPDLLKTIVLEEKVSWTLIKQKAAVPKRSDVSN